MDRMSGIFVFISQFYISFRKVTLTTVQSTPLITSTMYASLCSCYLTKVTFHLYDPIWIMQSKTRFYILLHTFLNNLRV